MTPVLIKARVQKVSHSRYYLSLFKCSCGTEFLTRPVHIRNGHTKSCGCLVDKINTTHGHNRVGKRTPTYSTWSNMIQRCTNPKATKWEIYGGRGISVCEQWKTFKGFLLDMGERPKGTSIDRIDGNGNYEPTNCRWATIIQQNNNLKGRK